MELLRRALLVGCLLPGLWLLRLAPLDPLLSVVPVDFAVQQQREAASVPDAQKTEDDRRRAQLPLSVYIEEFLQYNVFPASGPQWDRLLADIDALARGGRDEVTGPIRRKVGTGVSEAGTPLPVVFFAPDDDPIRTVVDQLAVGHGTTYLSFSREGGDRHYRVARHTFTREDFAVGHGFTGRPTPPAALLYPFRWMGIGCAVAGVLLFVLLPAAGRHGGTSPVAPQEWVALAAALLCFSAPLVAVGGSVQALTHATWLSVAAWAVAAVGLHFFASPMRNAPDPLPSVRDTTAGATSPPAGPTTTALFLREGLAFLTIALGPLAFLVATSFVLWDR